MAPKDQKPAQLPLGRPQPQDTNPGTNTPQTTTPSTTTGPGGAPATPSATPNHPPKTNPAANTTPTPPSNVWALPNRASAPAPAPPSQPQAAVTKKPMSFADAAKGPEGRTPPVAVPAFAGKSVVGRFASASTAAANNGAAAGPSGGSGGGAGGSSSAGGDGGATVDKDKMPKAEVAAVKIPQRPAKSHLEQTPTLRRARQESISLEVPENDQKVYDVRADRQYLDHEKRGLDGKDQHALRASFADDKDQTEIYVNHFQVTLPPGTILYEYLVSSDSPEWENATRNKRKVFMRDFIDMTELRGRVADIASDYRTKIITTYDVLGGSNHTPPRAELSVAVPCYKRGTRDQPTVVTLVMKDSRTFDMNWLQKYVAGQTIGYEETGALEAMNIMVSKAIAGGSNTTFQAGQNKFYYRPGWKELGKNQREDMSGLLAMRGYYCSVRPAMGTLTLNINTLTSAFYRPETVSWHLDRFRGKFPRQGDGNDQERAGNLRAANQHLAGLRGYVNFLRSRPGEHGNDVDIDNDHRRTKTINNIESYATEKMFKPKPEGSDPQAKPGGGQEVSVWNHLRQKYSLSAEDMGDKNQIAVNVGGKSPNEKFYLSGQMWVVGDQLYRRKLPADLLPAMIDIARRNPEENRRAILGEGFKSLHLQDPAIFGNLGITMRQDMMSVPARHVKKPTIIYGGSAQNPKRTVPPALLKWSTEGRVFFDTINKFASGPNAANVQFVYIGSSTGQPGDARIDYVTHFMNFHHLNGLQRLQTTTNQFMALDPTFLPDQVTDFCQSQKDNGVHLLVLMLPEKNAINAKRHAMFKNACDRFVGLKSAVLCERSMQSSLMKGSIGAYFGNYAMKLNLRLGNTNHMVGPASLPLVIRPGKFDCMMLGADVTHPGGGSTKGTPSIAAVVGSIDARFGIFLGSMRTQTARQEEIAAMEDMTYECLERWFKKNGYLPSRILLYRDGVNEEYYKRIRTTEIPAIREAYSRAWKDMANGSPPDGLPQITAVICAKRHNTRFYPKFKGQPSGNRGNCLPGTVVDSGITSPYYFDFFLQSHNALKGTARPTHYFVLENGMGFKEQDLQDLTNNLCYTYQRSTTAVSYAPPAYYADRLCERGRAYLRSFFDGEIDRNLTEDQVKRDVDTCWNMGGANAGNPWHSDLDDTMFWM